MCWVRGLKTKWSEKTGITYQDPKGDTKYRKSDAGPTALSGKKGEAISRRMAQRKSHT